MAFDSLVLVLHFYRCLAMVANPPQIKLVAQSFLVNKFQQTWTKYPMNFYRSANYFLGQWVRHVISSYSPSVISVFSVATSCSSQRHT